ncbi:MAG: hypothetical protein IJM37_04160 [Lachnospiraceae bacterium]|nr:hypothetical protein [Lachnospiraceae bacterium]
MKKNTRAIYFVLLCMIMVLSACGKAGDKLSSKDFSYANIQLGYDAQPYFDEMVGGIARVEKGYYYLSNDVENNCTYLMYFDENTQNAVPVCNKAECSHKAASDCDAVFSKDPIEGIGTPYGLWYYEGSLYIIINKLDINTELTNCDLYQISLDGSKRIKYIELFKTKNFGFVPYCHRGFLYIALDYDEDEVELYRVKLKKGAELEQIYTFKAEAANILDYQPYKKGIAFKCFSMEDGKIVSCVKYYDAETNEITELVSGLNDMSYRIIDNNYYYMIDKDLYVYNMDTKDSNLLYTFDYQVYLSYDGKYLYGDVCTGALLLPADEHYIYVLDTEGNLVDKIQTVSNCSCSFGDEKYLFQTFDLNENLVRLDESVIKAFDKSQIGTGKQEWIELPNTTVKQ